MIPRILDLPVGRRNFFLFGPRQTGKSTLIGELLKDKDHMTLDLLRREIFLKYRVNPGQLTKEIEYQLDFEHARSLIVFIDEIQKLPLLLDEVHHLIERYKGRLCFILTGSSARKLKRSSVNMLAGRAWEFRLYPFTFLELGAAFDLDSVLLRGSLPPVTAEHDPEAAFFTLDAYCNTYLKEEVLDEALVRNIEAFSRFLQIAADQSGRIVNFSTIARDTGVSSKTVKGYYQILEDTLVAYRIEPFLKSVRKRIISHPKYYLFDLGVINALCGRSRPRSIMPPTVYGMLFEHFIVLETLRLLDYRKRFTKMYHWRTGSGAEVDLIIEDGERLLAVEIKSSPRVEKRDLKGLASFMKDHPGAEPMCVSTCDLPYLAGDIPVMPWREYFRRLQLI